MTDSTETTAVPDTNFLVQYTKQRKKTRLFVATTIIAVVAFAGTLTLYIANPKTVTKSVAAKRGAFRGAFGGQGGPGGGAGRQQLDIKTFFSTDGSVDTSKVTALTQNVPSQFKDRLLANFGTRIDTAVTAGDITQAQGDALKTALGIK